MRYTVLLLSITLLACNNTAHKRTTAGVDTLKAIPETHKATKEAEPSSSKTHSNQRFRKVTVEKTGENKYRIRGQGQIFEANFNWIVEDGHDELYKGFQMTDAGAPEWGNFDFTIDAPKKRENSTLTLILFESSAMDGSRQHALAIALP